MIKENAIHRLLLLRHRKGNTELLNESLDMAIEALRQPERKTGKWLPDNNNYYEERFICSVCGRSYKVDTCMGKPMWDFCPCGADMRGAES